MSRYDYDVTIGYYFSEDEATKKAEEAEKNNPGMGFYVDEIEVI